MGFMYYYKIKAYVDDGMDRYYTWKYVFANNEESAKNRVLKHYNSQYDTYAKILEVYKYPIGDTMMFADLIDT